MGEVSYHIRLVILGGGGVGKTGIVKRFLFNTFCEKHRPTVEDLFFKEFNLGTMLLKVRKRTISAEKRTRNGSELLARNCEFESCCFECVIQKQQNSC